MSLDVEGVAKLVSFGLTTFQFTMVGVAKYIHVSILVHRYLCTDR